MILPQAFINMLALLGWNEGTEQELYSLGELVEKFSLDRVQAHGAKFDFEKAKWFNHEWIKRSTVARLKPDVKKVFEQNGIVIDHENKFEKIIELIKDRCTLLTDFWPQGSFFFTAPVEIDMVSILSKWNEKKNQFFVELIQAYSLINTWDAVETEKVLKEMAAASQIKAGELMMPLRVMLVGAKFGPGVFEIASVLGKDETIKRIEHALSLLKQA